MLSKKNEKKNEKELLTNKEEEGRMVNALKISLKHIFFKKNKIITLKIQ